MKRRPARTDSERREPPPISRAHRFGDWLRAHLDAKTWKAADLSRASAAVRDEPFGSGTISKWLNNQGAPPNIHTVLEIADLVEGDRVEALRAAGHHLIADTIEAAGSGKVTTRDPDVTKICEYDLPEEDKVALIRLYRLGVALAREQTDATAEMLTRRTAS